jgi:hypothetical protein
MIYIFEPYIDMKYKIVDLYIYCRFVLENLVAYMNHEDLPSLVE